MPGVHKALHWTGIPLRSIPASELEHCAFKNHREKDGRHV